MAVEGGHVGTWNTGLYGNDTAADLRDDFETVARAPWDGERLLAWILERYPAAGDPSDPEYTDVRLAAADLFWRNGIDHAPTVETARAIVADGLDLAAKRTLGMTERIIARRVAVLRDLADRLQRPNASAKPRRMFDGPEAFVMDAGDVLVYPTSKGDPRNPYVGPRKEERFYAMHPWEQDGWAMAIVLLRYHRYDVFARYVVALLRVDPASKPSMERLASRTIMHAARFAVYEPRPGSQGEHEPTAPGAHARRGHRARGPSRGGGGGRLRTGQSTACEVWRSRARERGLDRATGN